MTKRTRPAPSRTNNTAAKARRRVPNPLSPATRRLAKRLLHFTELPEPDRTLAFNTWLNSAGSPKRNAARRQHVRQFYALMQSIAEQLSPSDRASLRALGNEILAKASFNPSKAARGWPRKP